MSNPGNLSDTHMYWNQRTIYWKSGLSVRVAILQWKQALPWQICYAKLKALIFDIPCHKTYTGLRLQPHALDPCPLPHSNTYLASLTPPNGREGEGGKSEEKSLPVYSKGKGKVIHHKLQNNLNCPSHFWDTLNYSPKNWDLFLKSKLSIKLKTWDQYSMYSANI